MTLMKSVAAILVLFTLAGCSSDWSERRYAVSGQVTFQGKVVPFGEITFEPDASKGELGRASLSPIEDGKYEIPAMTGVRPAAYVIHVTGYSRENSTGSQETDGGFRELFPVYTQEVTFSAGNTTIDIEVPVAAK